MTDIKTFLYAWLGKSRKIPNYEVTTVGNANRQRFRCELRVEGFNYIGAGNSTNKKDSQSNAALDFCQFLVRSGNLNQQDLPKMAVNLESSGGAGSDQTAGNSNAFNQLPRGMVAPHQSMGIIFNDTNNQQSEILPYKRGPNAAYMAHVNQIGNRKMLEEAEETDANSEMHGNWTLENAKSRLHGFLQTNRINVDYKYTASGLDNNRSYFAEMTFFVNQVNKKLYAKEHGSNKQMASKACALSLTRQLYHYGCIETYTGEKKKKEPPKTAPFSVEVSGELKDKLAQTCMMFQTEPNLVFRDEEAVSLVPDHKPNLFPISEKSAGSVITWCPPTMNWNPWNGNNIDEGPLAHQSLDDISKTLYDFNVNQLANTEYQRNLSDRSKLPVFSYRDQILNAIQNNPVIIIRGATGCGKTTQIPQFILESYLERGQGAHCNIYVTQPRRISAVSVSERVAFERGEDLGISTGYSVRFESLFPRPYGGMLFCTVGVLLRKLENGLRGISHVVVDEIHERDINTDFLLVLLKDMTLMHPDLRIILMSATIDTTLFSEYFGNCPVIELHGRTFPVQEYFLEDAVQMLDFVPMLTKKRKNKTNNNDDDEEDDGGEDDPMDQEAEDLNCNTIVSSDYSAKTITAMGKLSEKAISFELIESLLKYIVALNQPGAVLIFMPGWNLIVSLLKYLRETSFGGNQYILLPLHSQIPREEQYKVFEDAPPGKKKIIVSTNIAESSITINDVVFVIDSCKVKQKIFTSRNNMTNYATVWASKANLQQRKGRAGRVRPGYCFFLISMARYERLDNHLTPEIFRTPLLDLALSIKLLRLGDIKEFLSRAIEPPPLDAVAEAEIALKDMDAFDMNAELTPLGRILARLPIEPKLGKMIIMGCICGIGDAVCTIAAASTFTEPFLHEGRNLRMMHKSMSGKRCSDHTALLVAFQQWVRAKYQGEFAEKEFCERKCLNMQTMRMTYEARNQLKDIMLFSGFPEECLYEANFDQNGNDPKLDMIISLLTYALYPNVCFHIDKRKLLTSDGKQALINKNSVNCGREIVSFTSPFFVFGEKIKTRAVSAKQMTMVTPLQLLLFASYKIETVPNDPSLVCMDNWIFLKMERELASTVVSVRQVIDEVLAMCTMDPILVETRPLKVTQFIETVRMLSDQTAAHIQFTAMPSNQGSINSTSGSGSFASIPQSDSTSSFEPVQKRFNSAFANSQQNTDNNNNSFSGPVGTFRGRFSERGGGYFKGHNNNTQQGFRTSNFSNNNNYNNRARSNSNNNNNQRRGGFGYQREGFNNNNNNNNYSQRGGFNSQRGNFNNQSAGFGRGGNFNNRGGNFNQRGNSNFNNNFNNAEFPSDNSGQSNRPLPPHLMNNFNQ